ncbi:histone deacetylase 8-like [Oppia nitens]|uniref:histone deacetylase 8-like n=1 Tax=Oppia nitens TaxID=1686743 RepID=UPI0023D98A2A|nr:histone deacetylase 8-like [Oppia nitens]
MSDQMVEIVDNLITKVCDNVNTVVGYVFSKQLYYHCNRLPKVKGRAFLVHELIKAYGLTTKCLIIESVAANDLQMRCFHSEDYLNFVKHVSDKMLSDEDFSEEFISEDFGIGYDCPPIPQLYQLMTHIAGSSISAADAIIQKRCDIVINWFGGWHHSHRDEASGYCYTNDIVFCILHLLDNGFDKILYVDLDLHHGDGVQNSFIHTNKVLSVSFHKYEIGFFPGTGDTNDVGFGSKGKYYSINVPLKDGITDECYVNIFKKVLNKIQTAYKSQVIVCQMGADGLAGDPMNAFNLTIDGYSECLKYLITINKPLILLGGGGYHLLNTARLWTSLTACALNEQLDNDIPDHSCFLAYRPTYELNIEPSLRHNLTSNEYIDNILENVYKNISFKKRTIN